MNTPWTPESWQKRLAQQQPNYDNPRELAEVIRRLTTLPPLVTVLTLAAVLSSVSSPHAVKELTNDTITHNERALKSSPQRTMGAPRGSSAFALLPDPISPWQTR